MLVLVRDNLPLFIILVPLYDNSCYSSLYCSDDPVIVLVMQILHLTSELVKCYSTHCRVIIC